MDIAPTGAGGAFVPGSARQAATTPNASAVDAFGLSFESLLKIILTQLTYQDPLKPMENFEFVSQLAQFSQIQQGQALADRMDQLVSAQATTQATSLLGRRVDVAIGSASVTGVVKAVAFKDGEAKITVETAQNQTIADLSLTAVTQIREGN